jgi:predicted transcriptional regulator
MPSPIPVSVRMPPELKEALSALAAADKRPLSNYVVLVLEEHVRGKQTPAEPRKPRASAGQAR